MIDNAPVKIDSARRSHDRGLLARRRAELLAAAGAEPRLRPGRPAVVVHGHRDVVRHARPSRPHRGAAGVRRPAADDEDGAAGRSTCRRRPIEPVREIMQQFMRLDRGRMPCELRPRGAGRRDRAVARAGRHRQRDQAHGAVAGLRRVGPPPQAEAGVSATCRATRFATCGWPARR